MLSTPVHASACERSVFYIIYIYVRGEMGYEFLSQRYTRAHAAFRMPNNIYTCCAPHLRLRGSVFPERVKRATEAQSQDEMRLFSYFLELKYRAVHASLLIARELRKTKGLTCSGVCGVFRRR